MGATTFRPRTQAVKGIFDEARVTGLVEPAARGDWTIEHQQAPDSGLGDSIGSVIRTGRGSLEPGQTYTVLRRRGTIVMSDTPDEIRDLAPILFNARGRVIVNGLGLGCVVKALLALPQVDHIDVVEVDPDVIALTGPYYEGDRCTIHRGDAFDFTWPPGTRWDCAWHDVWDELCADNLNEASGHASPGSYERLHRKYGRRVDWQGSWGWDFLKARA